MKRDPDSSIAPAELEGVTGGVSSNQQTQQALQAITDSLSDLKNQSNNSNTTLTKMLPFVVMAKAMRGY
jgi:hypothetical protein